MIDVKATILSTIKDRIARLRFLGRNDPATFKKILHLIVLDDLYDWSTWLEDEKETQLRLQEARLQYILNNCEFDIKNTKYMPFYINVNTPQTNDTWKRIWDDPSVRFVTSATTEKEKYQKPTCNRSQQAHFITLNAAGYPDIDFDSLTDCEKMDIYIDKTSGLMFYWNFDTCTWEQTSPQGLSEKDVVNIIEDNRQGIASTMDGDTIVTAPADKGSVSTIDMVTAKDAEDLL